MIPPPALRGTALAGLTLLLVWAPAAADGIPYFARRYGVACSQCHVAPPRLNATGEAFVARGYELPELRARRTWPLAVWATARADALPGVADVRGYGNRVEVISGGRISPRLWYFVEWRAVSLETRSDGSLRDRSGRFEDLFVTAALGRAELTIGQFRQVGQVDVSRRIGLSEPLLLSASLPGTGGGSAREISLRGFAPAGRSPAARLGWTAAPAAGWRWTTSAAVPLPGELSLPLTREARAEASNELEWAPKGVVLESFIRRGLFSVGGHAFYDHGGRWLAAGLATGAQGPFHWTVGAGAARSAGVTRGRWSLEGEWFPWWPLGAGVRVEGQGADGLPPAVLTYVNGHLPGTSYTVRLTVERRIQRGRNATFVEFGTVF